MRVLKGLLIAGAVTTAMAPFAGVHAAQLHVDIPDSAKSQMKKAEESAAEALTTVKNTVAACTAHNNKEQECNKVAGCQYDTATKICNAKPAMGEMTPTPTKPTPTKTPAPQSTAKSHKHEYTALQIAYRVLYALLCVLFITACAASCVWLYKMAKRARQNSYGYPNQNVHQGYLASPQAPYAGPRP